MDMKTLHKDEIDKYDTKDSYYVYYLLSREKSTEPWVLADGKRIRDVFLSKDKEQLKALIQITTCRKRKSVRVDEIMGLVNQGFLLEFTTGSSISGIKINRDDTWDLVTYDTESTQWSENLKILTVERH
jgi:hypothetical protein